MNLIEFDVQALRGEDRLLFNALREMGFEMALVRMTKLADTQEHDNDYPDKQVRYGLGNCVRSLTGGKDAAAVCKYFLSSECSFMARGDFISTIPMDPFDGMDPHEIVTADEVSNFRDNALFYCVSTGWA